MFAAEFEIKNWAYDRRRYLVEGEDIPTLFKRAWSELDLSEIIDQGDLIEPPAVKREFSRLLSLYDKCSRGELSEGEVRGLDIRLSVGRIRCLRLSKS